MLRVDADALSLYLQRILQEVYGTVSGGGVLWTRYES